MAKWITKANDAVLSHCQCEHPLASLPGQLDCPWCGCGYLMTCTFCRKAFTYGKIINVDRTFSELVAADRQRGGYDTDQADVREDVDQITEMLEPFAEGDTVLYFDGCYFAADERDLRFAGIFAEHDLLVLPHELARVGLTSLSDTVGQPSYWLERERAEGE
jgi:hypothetical protein